MNERLLQVEAHRTH